jgi:hypothetical protein
MLGIVMKFHVAAVLNVIEAWRALLLTVTTMKGDTAANDIERSRLGTSFRKSFLSKPDPWPSVPMDTRQSVLASGCDRNAAESCKTVTHLLSF